MNLIIAITGASGAIYGIKMLQILKEFENVNTHLVISQPTKITIKLETNYKFEEVISLADNYYNNTDISANIASGSYKTDGMIIAPCSMNSVSKIAYGTENDLIARAASVILKEHRKLVLMTRETPLSQIHLSNMLKVSQAGGIIAPITTTFYNHPKKIEDMLNHSIMRTLDLFDINTDISKRWKQ